MAEEEVEILRMGHQGEGVAERTPPLFVPYTLPGERVRVATDESDHGSLKGILTPSPERIKPACAHFTRCGGCALQHWQEDAYASWKEGLVAQAFSQQGISAEISPIIRAKPHTRRRASFAVTRTKSGAVAGYYARGTHQIVPVSMCPLVRPEIESAMQPLADLVAGGLSRKGRASVLVTVTASGLDVMVGGGKPLDIDLRMHLSEGADRLDLARLSWEGEIVAERRLPLLALSGIPVTLAPGAFLQATADGEAALVQSVLAGMEGAGDVADLFAGCGTFTFALARNANVLALEGEAGQVDALERAFHREGPAHHLKRITAERRDLFRRPLLASEMKKLDGIVFDPPRAGAAAQAAEIAKSAVPRLVAVSCNPATLARDLRALLDGGYEISRVQPVDQFLWSPHIEVAVHLTRR